MASNARYVLAVSRLIDWTGERCVPWVADTAMLYEHYHRYLWAARLLGARRILDVGSGEGYGAAILAGAGAEVLGVDIDAAAVRHAAARYERPGLGFMQASVLDLSGAERGGFDAVVAFEIIEHVEDHAGAMEQIRRVLRPEGILIMSTPDKDLYNAATGQVNEFHSHELTLAEFRELLGESFRHVAVWGQRTMTGSHLRAVDPSPPAATTEETFFVERLEEGLREVSEPRPLFYVALASDAPLPPLASSSTLADYGLELLHETARAHAVAVAERDELLAVANTRLAHANAMLEEKREEVLAVGAKLASVERQLLASGDRLYETEVRLSEAQDFISRVEESVMWQLLQRARGAIYGRIGRDSRAGRVIGSLLRRLGRVTSRSR